MEQNIISPTLALEDSTASPKVSRQLSVCFCWMPFLLPLVLGFLFCKILSINIMVSRHWQLQRKHKQFSSLYHCNKEAFSRALKHEKHNTQSYSTHFDYEIQIETIRMSSFLFRIGFDKLKEISVQPGSRTAYFSSCIKERLISILYKIKLPPCLC